MGRGDDQSRYKAQQQQQYDLGNQYAQGQMTHQADIYGGLVPKLNDTYEHAGYTPGEKADLTRAGLEGLAGTYDSAAAGLQDHAARTGNSAGVNSTAEELARERARQSEQFTSGLNDRFARARMSQQDDVLGKLSGLYGMSGQEANSALGTTGAGVSEFGRYAVQPGFWDQYFLQSAKGAGQALAAGAG